MAQRKDHERFSRSNERAKNRYKATAIIFLFDRSRSHLKITELDGGVLSVGQHYSGITSEANSLSSKQIESRACHFYSKILKIAIQESQ